MNQSEIHVMMDSGAGIRVQEAYGMLSVMVILPPHFNESAVVLLNLFLALLQYLH